jgi:hypothetical protein
MPPGYLALGQIGRVAAAVGVDLLLGQVELDHPGDRPGQELAVVTDQHRPGPQALHEPLQPFEPVQVEVVGGLVEQKDVIAAEQQGRHTRAGGLAAGQRGHRLVEVDRQTQLGGHLPGSILQVGAAEGQPALQGIRILVVGAVATLDQPLGRGVQIALGLRHPRTPGEEAGHRLTRTPLGFLWQITDGRRRRTQLYGAVLGGDQAPESPQQGRLPGTVDPDQADDLLGGDEQMALISRLPRKRVGAPCSAT